jgi:hypothetical protein
VLGVTVAAETGENYRSRPDTAAEPGSDVMQAILLHRVTEIKSGSHPLGGHWVTN